MLDVFGDVQASVLIMTVLWKLAGGAPWYGTHIEVFPHVFLVRVNAVIYRDEDLQHIISQVNSVRHDHAIPQTRRVTNDCLRQIIIWPDIG